MNASSRLVLRLLRRASGRALRAAHVLALLLALVAAGGARAQTFRAMTPRYEVSTYGHLSVVGNTNMTCKAGSLNYNAAFGNKGTNDVPCASVQNQGPGLSPNATTANDYYPMVNVDVDGDAATYNSSTADLAIPAGARVRFAALYWGARRTVGLPDSASRNTVRFKVPGAGAYRTVTATQFTFPLNVRASWHAFADVTSLVQNARGGTYTVANVITSQGTAGTLGNYAGWSLFVVLEDPSEPLRYMSVSDGLIQVFTGTPYTGVFSGFVTPFTGAYTPRMAAFVLDGDNDDSFANRDSVRINATFLRNAYNPVQNVFNSTISDGGANVTARNPSYPGTLGLDLDWFDLSPAIVPPGARSVNVRLTTAAEGYLVHAIAFQSEIYNPEMQVDKRVSDLNGGNVQAGDVLEYTVTVKNNNVAPGYFVKLSDPIPVGTTYVPGSMSVVSGVGAGAKTDAAGDDQAHFINVAGQDTVEFRLGTGATPTRGGTVDRNTTSVVRFRVTVNAGLPVGTALFNRVQLSYNEGTTGGTLVGTYDASIATQGVGTNLQVVKTLTSGAGPYTDGQNVAFQIAYTNLSATAAEDVNVQDLLPPGLTFVSATTPTGWTATLPAVGTNGAIKWSRATSAGNATATFTVTAKVTGIVGTDLRDNTAQVNATTLDPISDNNESTVSFTVKPLIDLRVAQTASATNVNVGQTVTYTVTVANERATVATGVTVKDLLPAGVAFVSAAPGVGTYTSTSGLWDVGTVGPNETKTLTLTGTVTQTGALVNTAQVASANETDADSTPDNTVASEDDQASTTVVATYGTSDVALAYSVTNPVPALGEVFYLDLTATNEHATRAATDLQVAAFLNALPSGVEIVGGTVPAGTTAADHTLWLVGALAPGQSKTLRVALRFTTAQTVQTCAEVARMNETDVDSSPYNGSTTEDDDACVTVGTAGSSSGGVGGLESNGELSQDLARVLYARTQRPAAAAPVVFSKDRPAFSVLGTDDDGARLMALVPAAGPEQSRPEVVTPGDLLGVTNATGVLGVDYVRAKDRRRMGALLMLATPNGQLYEHTKAICDRLRTATLADLDTLVVRGQPFVVNTLRYDDGTVDYAASFIAYASEQGTTVDSRFLLSQYAVPAGAAVTNVQVWSPSAEYTREMIARVLDGFGPVAFRQDEAVELPRVYVERAEYRDGALHLRVNNTARASWLRLSGASVARAEGTAHVPLSAQVTLPADSASVWVTIPTGPMFDAGFFVETDLAGTPDQLYLADGAWSMAPAASADASVASFTVQPEADAPAAAPGVRFVERAPTVRGDVKTTATLFRYLRAGGPALSLGAFRYLDLTLAGEGQVMVRLEQATAEGTTDVFYRTLRLTEAPQRHRIELQDFRSVDGRRFSGAASVLSFVVVGNSHHATPFALAVSRVRFAGGAGDASGDVPEATLLEHPSPNPARTRALVAYRLAEAGPVRLTVYDLLGRAVLDLRHAPAEAGFHRADADVSALPSGRYLLVLEAGGQRYTQPLVVMR